MSQDPKFESRESKPAWSPDGSRIAFQSNAARNFVIWVIRHDGTNLTRLTTGPSNNEMPAWSPDGAQIAFGSNRSGTWGIWIMKADGTNPRRVTSLGRESDPAFSPDGRQFVFSSGLDNRGSNLMIINVDGTGLRQLTTGTFHDWYPRWSARGIVFQSNRSGVDALWIIQPDGSGLRALQTIPGAFGYEPAVLSEGTRVAFSAGYGISEFNFRNGTYRSIVQLHGFFIAIQVMGVPTTTGVVPIAVDILATPTFNPVRQIDQTSITLGVTGNERSLRSCRPIEMRSVGAPHLVCVFDPRFTGFDGVRSGITEGILRAWISMGCGSRGGPP
jgi:dipeptidyl aminopeptidase/acylaminoacyl peptidase